MTIELVNDHKARQDAKGGRRPAAPPLVLPTDVTAHGPARWIAPEPDLRTPPRSPAAAGQTVGV